MSHSIQSLMQSVALAQLLRAKQVCELLQISKSTLYSWLKVGGRYHNPQLPQPIYLSNGRTPFWRLADLKEFVSATGAQSPTQGESETVLIAAKESEAIAPILKTDIVEDDCLLAPPMRQTTFKEFVLKDGLVVRMRTRRHGIHKVDVRAATSADIASSAHISHSRQS